MSYLAEQRLATLSQQHLYTPAGESYLTILSAVLMWCWDISISSDPRSICAIGNPQWIENYVFTTWFRDLRNVYPVPASASSSSIPKIESTGKNRGQQNSRLRCAGRLWLWLRRRAVHWKILWINYLQIVTVPITDVVLCIHLCFQNSLCNSNEPKRQLVKFFCIVERNVCRINLTILKSNLPVACCWVYYIFMYGIVCPW